jgi:hypothetical protein
MAINPVKDSYLEIPDLPGIGIEWDEDTVTRYRYEATHWFMSGLLWVIHDRSGQSHTTALVRFASESGQMPGVAICPLCAKSGHSHCSKICLFDHLVGEGDEFWRHGKAQPLAVLRLITKSNLVGCRTGRSAGFAPLRIFPT